MQTKEYKSGAIIINGDQRCLNRCTFCPGLVDESISPSSKFSTFKEDASYFINKKYDEIEISGNDPIQYSKITEVVKYLKDNGIKKIILSTHGRNMKDNSLAKELSEAGLDFCRIPLYGSKASIHNKATQFVAKGESPLSVGNSFEDTVSAIKNCISNGIKLKGHIVPMQFNQNDLHNIVDLYLDLTKGYMEALIIASACLSSVNKEYSADWYLPISEATKAVQSIINHPIKKDFPYIYFSILDFPYCVVEKLDRSISNTSTVPNLGNHKVSEELRSKESDQIPHYRIKKQFEICKGCVANKLCAGIYENDVTLFGTGELKPITTETILNYPRESSYV